MAKIGIITFHNTIDNYGQVLQYLATQEFLKSLGHDATLVVPLGHHNSVRHRICAIIRKLFRKVFPSNELISISESEIPIEEKQKRQLFEHWAEITVRQEKEHPRFFEDFRQKYFSIQIATYEDILKSGYRAFCVGSDQIWSCAGRRTLLGWVSSSYRKFTIAPSIGHREYSNEEINSFKKYIKTFDFITVRENNGIEFCKRCGRGDAIKILDPTFLLEAQNYDNYSTKEPQDKPYAFIYMLGGEISLPINAIIEFCQKNNLEIKYVESQGREERLEKISATVNQWLGLIKGASYIFTNSFHGMAFSVIYHKAFMAFPLIGLMEGMNERIFDTAEALGMKDRIYSNSLDAIFNNIKWEDADKIIANNKELLIQQIKDLNIRS